MNKKYEKDLKEIKENMLKVEKEIVKNFFYRDDEVFLEYSKKVICPNLKELKRIIDETVDDIYFDDNIYEIYLDEKYLDISYITIGGKIINIDLFYFDIMNYIEDLSKQYRMEE